MESSEEEEIIDPTIATSEFSDREEEDWEWLREEENVGSITLESSISSCEERIRHQEKHIKVITIVSIVLDYFRTLQK